MGKKAFMAGWALVLLLTITRSFQWDVERCGCLSQPAHAGAKLVLIPRAGEQGLSQVIFV